MQEFESELKKILDEKFIEKAKNLKKGGHIFNPLFYLFFTRLVELSSIFRDIILPTKYELEELFAMRRSFLEIDYRTLTELLRRAWVYERSRGKDFSFSKDTDDLLYLLYRMGKIQRDIDSAIIKYAKWRKDELIELYFTMLRVFLEIEDKINEELNLKEAQLA